MKPLFRLAGLALAATTLFAQNFAGDWQGTLKAGTSSLRVVLKIEKATDGKLSSKLYTLDAGPDATRADAITTDGQVINLTFDSLKGKFTGTLTADGNTLKGTWKQVGNLPIDLERATKATAWPLDSDKHKAQFVTVDTDVKLEVLDWGGTGKPLVFLAGLGNSAHVFDEFAPKFTATHHVYGITSRGFGESSSPKTGYQSDRLGDDVLAVLDALKLDRAVLAGHSIAGEELSSIGSRHPEKVAGLIYLDAGFPYAFYDKERGNLDMDLPEIMKKLDRLTLGKGGLDLKKVVKELLEKDLPLLQKLVADKQADLEASPPNPNGLINPGPAQWVLDGRQKYTNVPVPVLAIYALPHAPPAQLKSYTTLIAKMEARDLETTGAQAAAFEKGIPTARVVRIPHADHYVFRSNEAEVLKEMNAFLSGLK